MDVDYSLTLVQTFTKFAIACMQTGHVNDILKAALARPSEPSSDAWPSWVPDWRQSPRKVADLPEYGLISKVDYSRETSLLISAGVPTQPFTVIAVHSSPSARTLDSFFDIFGPATVPYSRSKYIVETISKLARLRELKLKRQLQVYIDALLSESDSTSRTAMDKKEHLHKLVRKFDDLLAKAIPGRFFFCSKVVYPNNYGTKEGTVICGSSKVALRKGDHILLYAFAIKGEMLVLRPMGDSDKLPVYRLIGTARMYRTKDTNAALWSTDVQGIFKFYLQ